MRGNGYAPPPQKKKKWTKNGENQTWNKETKQIIPNHKDASSGSEFESRKSCSKAAPRKGGGGKKILPGDQSCCLFCPLLDKTLNHVPSQLGPTKAVGFFKQQPIWRRKSRTSKDVFQHCTHFINSTYITKCCHDKWYTDVQFSLSAHSSLRASLLVKVMSGTMFTRQPVTRGCVRCVSFALYLEQLQRRNVECWDSAEWGERSGLTPIKRDFDRGVYGSRKKGEGRQEKSKQREW